MLRARKALFWEQSYGNVVFRARKALSKKSSVVPEMACFGNNRAGMLCFVPESARFGNNRTEMPYRVNLNQENSLRY